MSNFNYCPVVWHFCSVASTNKMEKIQERALRHINNDSTSPLKTLLVISNNSPLHVRWMKTIASEVYKIVNNLSTSYIQDLVQVKVSNYDFRNEHTAVVPRVRTTFVLRTGPGHFILRPPGYGTVCRMRSDLLSLILSSGGCCVPGMALAAVALFVLTKPRLEYV